MLAVPPNEVNGGLIIYLTPLSPRKDIETQEVALMVLPRSVSKEQVIEALIVRSKRMVGHCGLEPQTSVLSGLRSNQLS